MAIAPPITVIQQSFEGIGGRAVGGGAGSVTALTAAQIRAIADLSGYVPYTGATAALDLGTNALTVGAVTSTGIITSSANITVGGNTSVSLEHWSGVGRTGSRYFMTYAGGQYVGLGYNWSLAFSGTDAAVPDIKLSRAAAGILAQRNGTNAQQFRINKTWTSTTSEEYLSLGYNATAATYDVASKVGSAGGVNQPIRLGHYAADGTTFSGLSVATDGAVTFIAATTAKASLNIPSGVAPTTPTNGDVWSNGSDILVRLGGVTYTLTKA